MSSSCASLSVPSKIFPLKEESKWLFECCETASYGKLCSGPWRTDSCWRQTRVPFSPYPVRYRRRERWVPQPKLFTSSLLQNLLLSLSKSWDTAVNHHSNWMQISRRVTVHCFKIFFLCMFLRWVRFSVNRPSIVWSINQIITPCDCHSQACSRADQTCSNKPIPWQGALVSLQHQICPTPHKAAQEWHHHHLLKGTYLSLTCFSSNLSLFLDFCVVFLQSFFSVIFLHHHHLSLV